MKTVAIKHRDGWCLAKKKKTKRYQERVATLCGYYVSGPFGFEFRKPNCKECLALVAREVSDG